MSVLNSNKFIQKDAQNIWEKGPKVHDDSQSKVSLRYEKLWHWYKFYQRRWF